jgi:hypothetical protein
MKTISILAIVLFALSCSKENTSTNINSFNTTNAVVQASVPLNDLGTGTYQGETGGLYPNGSNQPSGQYATDLMTVCTNIVPIDTFGNPSSVGKILFASIGGSTGGHNMKMLRSKTIGNPATNPDLKLISFNNGTGEASLNSIMNPKSDYWDHITQVLAGTKSSYRQVQILYLETDDSSKNISWPFRPTLIKDHLDSCLRVFKKKFKNIKLVYVLGRTRTFGAKAMWNREPSPYYFGWGCKWAIEDQMNGTPGTKYKGVHAVAPMITWGFYQWADSLPRKTDNFYWRYSETADGLHANFEGQDTLSSRFQNFLLTDPYAKNWYAAP